jgi:hypothetical protein
VLALDFREWLGGEEKINKYCHNLALAGGRRLAWVVRGSVMEGEKEIVANMVTFALFALESLALIFPNATSR